MGIKHLRRRGLEWKDCTGLWLWGEICQLGVIDSYKSLLGLVMRPAQGGNGGKAPLEQPQARVEMCADHSTGSSCD